MADQPLPSQQPGQRHWAPEMSQAVTDEDKIKRLDMLPPAISQQLVVKARPLYASFWASIPGCLFLPVPADMLASLLFLRLPSLLLSWALTGGILLPGVLFLHVLA